MIFVYGITAHYFWTVVLYTMRKSSTASGIVGNMSQCCNKCMPKLCGPLDEAAIDDVDEILPALRRLQRVRARRRREAEIVSEQEVIKLIHTVEEAELDSVDAVDELIQMVEAIAQHH